MNATAEEIDRWLAENVCGWTWNGTFWLDGNYVVHGKAWKPTRDRNHLADVLEKIPADKRMEVLQTFDELYFDDGTQEWYWFLLTAEPEKLCRAIYQALNTKQETRDDE